VIPTCDQQDDSVKVELEVPSNAPQDGDTVPYSSSEDHIEETNSDSYGIPSSEEQHTSDTTPLLVTGREESSKSLHAIPLLMKMD